MSVRIVQLSDLHLYRDRQGVLAGVPTWSTFHAVLDLVGRQQDDFDYLVITGDLAQDEALETYMMLRETLGNWIDRCRIIPGNHDDRGHLRKVFPELFPKREGPLTFALECGGWHVIGVDSQIPGDTKGHIDSGQLHWLRAQLASNPEFPALVFVHHPPISINVAWLDRLGLTDPAEFIELIENSPQIKLVCAGHVHQEFAGRVGVAAAYTTPSTCVQWSDLKDKGFDISMAGYRLITLGKHGYHTEVHRLSQLS